MFKLIREKETRLCSRRYQMKDRAQLDSGRVPGFYGRYVFPDDAEDIKSHRWFKNVAWGQLHSINPPFVPHIHSPEDTHYFDESGTLDDMSDSAGRSTHLPPNQVKEILNGFRTSFQNLAAELIKEPYDTVRLRRIDLRIDESPRMNPAEKDVMKHFVRMYGHKERKRPRDRVLRDPETKDVAMDIRKQTAFMGYTWRRMRPEGYALPRWVL